MHGHTIDIGGGLTKKKKREFLRTYNILFSIAWMEFFVTFKIIKSKKVSTDNSA